MSSRTKLFGPQRREALMRFERKPRHREPLPSGEIDYPRPTHGDASEPTKPTLWTMIPSVLMGLSFAIVYLIFSPSRWYWAILVAIPSLLFPLGQYMVYRGKKKNYDIKVAEAQGDFESRVRIWEARVRQVASKQRDNLVRENPPVSNLIRWAASLEKRESCLWDRLPDDDDFLAVRIGTTDELPLCVELRRPDEQDHDPRMDPIRAFLDNHKKVRELPVLLDFRQRGLVGIVSNSKKFSALELAHTVIANVVAHHSPEHVQLCLVSHRPDAESQWNWVKWLPHANALADRGSGSRIALSIARTEQVLAALSQELTKVVRPHIVLVVDLAPEVLQSDTIRTLLNFRSELRASVLFIEEPVPPNCHMLTLHDGSRPNECDLIYSERRPNLDKAQGGDIHGTAELIDTQHCERLARALAPLQVDMGGPVPLPDNIWLVHLLGASEPEALDLFKLYGAKGGSFQPRPAPELLDAFVGVNQWNKPKHMILREIGGDWHQGGHGSNVLVAGKRGSGKTVLMELLILSLAATHSPTEVNFFVANFKAGISQLEDLRGLPHLTNYIADSKRREADEALIRRCMDGLMREFNERQETMRGFPDIWRYNTQNPQKALPHLLVVIDEFGRGLEIANKDGEFEKTIVNLVRLGRAAGMYLVLGDQRGKNFTSDIKANIDIHIGLRMEAGEEDAIFDPVLAGRAADITTFRNGRAYIQYVDSRGVKQFYWFQSARADGASVAAGETAPSPLAEVAVVSADGHEHYSISGNHDSLDAAADNQSDGAPHGKTDAVRLVRHIAEFCKRHGLSQARPIVAPPLPEPEGLPLHTILSEATVYKCWSDTDWWAGPVDLLRRLVAPVGRMDMLADRSQPVWEIDLNQGNGHFWVVGLAGDESGKDQFLQTLLLSLTTTHTPEDLYLYLIDFGRGSLRGFEDLPHCGGIFQHGEVERLNLLLNFIEETVSRRLSGDQTHGAEPAIVVVFDNYRGFSEFIRGGGDRIAQVFDRAQAADVHFIFSAQRHQDLPTPFWQGSTNRLALRLSTREDIEDNLQLGQGKRIQMLPAFEGRGFIRIGDTPVECQAAIPVASDAFESEVDPVQAAIVSMTQIWGDKPRAPQIEALPTCISLRELYRTTPCPRSVSGQVWIGPIGRSFGDIFHSPVFLDLKTFGPCTVVLGLPGSGKSEFLATFSRLVSAVMHSQVKLYILDFKQGPLQALQDEIRGLSYVKDIPGAEVLLNRLKETLESNPGPGAAPPHTILMIDDMAKFKDNATGLMVDTLNSCFGLRRERLKLLMVLEAPTSQTTNEYRNLYPFFNQAFKDLSAMIFPHHPEDVQGFFPTLPMKADFKNYYAALHPKLTPGRGFLVRLGGWDAVQVAIGGLSALSLE